MQSWITSNGGLVASVVLICACLNVVFSAVQNLCNKLKIQEPSFIQKAASVVSTITSWLSANTPSVPASGSGPAAGPGPTGT